MHDESLATLVYIIIGYKCIVKFEKAELNMPQYRSGLYVLLLIIKENTN